MHLNILKDSEFLKSVGRVWKIFELLYTIELIPYFTVDFQLVISNPGFPKEFGHSNPGFPKEFGQSFFLNISLIIARDKPFKNL